MAENKVKFYRYKRSLTQVELAEAIGDGVTNVVIGYIEGGKVLPTTSGMKAMCEVLETKPTDLYDAEDLQLESVMDELCEQRPKGRGDRGHKGKVEFRTWLTPMEKFTLEDAVRALGYRSSAEWFREMRRNTIARIIRLNGRETGKQSRKQGSSQRESNTLLKY